MGWDFMHYEGTPEEAIREHLDKSWEMVDISHDGNVYYFAARRKDTGVVSATVVLTSKRKKEHYNFGMKWMSESMIPCYYNCPKRIIDKLTPTDNECAKIWRSRCIAKRMEKNERSKANKEAHAEIRDGMRIRFDMPIKFMGGQIENEFIIQKQGRKVRFISVHFGFRAQISRWKERKYTIEPN